MAFPQVVALLITKLPEVCGCTRVIPGPGGTPEEYGNLQAAVRLSGADSPRSSHRATIRTDLSAREGQVTGGAHRAVAAQ